MAISFDPETKSYSDGVTTLEIKDGVYEIDSIEKLKLFRDAVNAGNSFSGQTVSLTQSIDLQDEEWTPIGKNGARFAGTFDGNGNTISNLKITKSLSNTADNCGIGFFGYTNSPAKIVDLNIEMSILPVLYTSAQLSVTGSPARKSATATSPATSKSKAGGISAGSAATGMSAKSSIAR